MQVRTLEEEASQPQFRMLAGGTPAAPAGSHTEDAAAASAGAGNEDGKDGNDGRIVDLDSEDEGDLDGIDDFVPQEVAVAPEPSPEGGSEQPKPASNRRVMRPQGGRNDEEQRIQLQSTGGPEKVSSVWSIIGRRHWSLSEIRAAALSEIRRPFLFVAPPAAGGTTAAEKTENTAAVNCIVEDDEPSVPLSVRPLLTMLPSASCDLACRLPVAADACPYRFAVAAASSPDLPAPARGARRSRRR